MKKKGRLSLALASVLMALSLLWILLGVLAMLGVLPSSFDSLMSFIRVYTALTKYKAANIEFGIFLFIEAVIIFSFRQRRPYSLFVVFTVPIMYGTLFITYRLFNGETRPEYIMANIDSSKRVLMLLLFVIEFLLTIVISTITANYDERWRKERDRVNAYLEREGYVESALTRKEKRARVRAEKDNALEEAERKRADADLKDEMDRAYLSDEKKRRREEKKRERLYDRERERAERLREKKRKREETKRLMAIDRLDEREELKAERRQRRERRAALREEKREAVERKKREEVEDKRRREAELSAPSECPSLPRADEPLSFPEFQEMPSFKYIESKPKLEARAEGESEYYQSSTILDTLKKEAESAVVAESEEEKEDAFRFQIDESHRFKSGGMLEATIESLSTPLEEVERPTKPIIGFEGLNTINTTNDENRSSATIATPPLEARLEERSSDSNILPSGLSPDHPRAAMFRALQSGTVVSYSGGSEPKKEESERKIAPSNLSPSHPRYAMFEALANAPQHEEVREEERTSPRSSDLPSYLSEDHPRSALFHALNNKREESTIKNEEIRKTESSNEAALRSSDLPSYLSEDHPRSALFHALSNKREESTIKNEEIKKTESSIERKDESKSSAEVTPSSESIKATPTPIREENQTPQNKKERDKDKLLREVEDDGELYELAAGVGGLQSSEIGFASIAERAKYQYKLPPLYLLKEYPSISQELDEDTIRQGEIIVSTYKEQGVTVELDNIVKGPTVSLYELKLASGTRIQRIEALDKELNYALGGKNVRILPTIVGKQAVGVEVPNDKKAIVGFRDMVNAMNDNPKASSAKIPMILGKTITGAPVVIDVAKMPHMIIAGTTGSGKSVCINSFISTILYSRSPQDVRLILIDPKIVELSLYNGIPHLLTPVISDQKRVVKILNFLVEEMERRYTALQHLSVRNIDGYNEKIRSENILAEKMPYIVLIMDEFADLMSTIGKDIETQVGRLAAKARAAGIHLILATQRPTATVVTGNIKSNLPARIAFSVSSGTDSRVILDQMGAETLLGKGDMLLLDPAERGLQRIQGAFLSDREVESVVKFVKENAGELDYLDETIFEDETEDREDDDFDSDASNADDDEVLYEKAKQLIYERKSASATMLQRKLKIGFSRAGRIIDLLEERGVVGPARGSKSREILKYE